VSYYSFKRKDTTINPLLGILLHALGGFAAGSFYIPFRKVRDWAWESYWLVNGIMAWVLMPIIVAYATVPNLVDVLRGAPLGSSVACYLFGILWGVGGLTFGLTMRYLGMSLGYAIALGNTAAFGTVIPTLYFGTFGMLISKTSGLVTFGGVAVCLIGITVCGWAGINKERGLSEDVKKETIREFNFSKGVWIALICGVMSACFAFGIAAGKPMAEYAVSLGTQPLWQNSPVFILIMAGGFTTNTIWCLYLNVKNGSYRDYSSGGVAQLANNVMFSALAGTIWYCQFMFYGMGTTKMGAYDFSSWSIHMAFIIIFSNIWGLIFREWKNSDRKTYVLITLGLLILVVSTMIIGLGNYLAAKGM
jgi:L-rhamnose-H+ transport protein